MRVRSNILGRNYFQTIFLGDKNNNKMNGERLSGKAYQGHRIGFETFTVPKNKG